ncbi:MAG: hypothetical protein AAGA65_20105 [Actinomycetota bacterium]
MTIKKGESWGEPAGPDHSPVPAADDADLARLAEEARRLGTPLVATVTTGDLRNTLGVAEGRPVAERHAYPIDLGLATLDPDTDPAAPPIPFVAHLIIGDRGLPGAAYLERALGHGPAITVAVMNAAWLGDLRLGPRAHPNDGRLDVTEGRVRFRERREARRRAKAGSHLPHPDLGTTRVTTWRSKFDRPRPVSIDGVDRGRVLSVSVTLVPDALTVVA